MNTVISFIGKGRKELNSKTIYSKTKYELNGYEFETSFLGKILVPHLKADRLILIGTPSSSWDMLLEDYDESDEAHLSLLEAIENGAVCESFLANYSRKLSVKLDYQIDCILFDFAIDELSQVKLLLKLNDILSENETISIDITHSFRHLPMLSLVAARYLGLTKKVQINEIFYGAFEMRDVNVNTTPVIPLKGMLGMLDWVEKLACFDKDNDFSVFSELLIKEGLNKDAAKQLSQAAFFERISRPTKAKKFLDGSIKELTQFSDGIIFSLFKESLIKRLDWRNKSTQAQREFALASNYLDKKDFLRAAIYILEATITQNIPAKQLEEARIWDENIYELRDEFKKPLMKNKEFRHLNNLRNALAHGDIEKGDSSIQSLLSNEEALDVQLRKWLKLFSTQSK